MSQHSLYHYSITIQTDDEAVLHCLRALSQFAQKDGNKRIPWGGTKKEDWESASHKVKFHFSSPAYRETLLIETIRLLPKNLWEKISENDNDPAKPQS